MRRGPWRMAVGAALILYGAFCFVYIIKNYAYFFWDFKVCYAAARNFIQGSNPYNPYTSAHHQFFLYPYPPLTLFFYKFFLAFDRATSASIFLFLDFALIMGLFYVWVKHFLDEKAGLSFYLFCLLAFNASIYLGVCGGNIVFFEQFLIWLGLYFFLKRRLWGFCAAIVLAASIKIQPVLFLSMLFLLEGRKKYVYLACSLISFGLIAGLSYLCYPHLFPYFLGFVFSVDERGFINPSTLSFIRDLSDLWDTKTGIILPAAVPLAAYFFVVSGVILVTLRRFKLLAKLKAKNKDKLAIFLFCLAFSLVLPRMKDYSYVLLLVPTYYIIANTSYKKIFPFCLFLVVIPSVYITLPGHQYVTFLLWNYYSLLIAYGAWGLTLYEISSLYEQQEKTTTLSL